MADDKQRFNVSFMHLATVTRLSTAEVTPDTKRAYWEALQDVSIEALESAAARLAKSASWMPKASEWREVAREIQRTTTVRAQIPGERAGEWRHECQLCEDTGWCYDGGKTLHEVVLSAYAGRPRMHRCPCRATNHTYQRHAFGGNHAA